MPALLSLFVLACAPARAQTDADWKPFMPAGLPNSEESLIAADEARERVYLFGERTTTESIEIGNDTYVLDMSTSPPAFQRLATLGSTPPPRHGASLIFDPLRNRLLLFGGRSFQALISSTEVWQLSLDGTPTWSQLAPTGSPPGPRVRASVIYDSRRDRVLVYGGAYVSGSLDFSLSDTWSLSLSPTLEWTQLATAGAASPGLAGAAAVYDPQRDRMLVYGGGSDSESRDPQQDLWALTLATTPTWSLLPTLGDPPRSDIYEGGWYATYDSSGDRVTVVTSHWFDADQFKSLPVTELRLGASNEWQAMATHGADPGPRLHPSVTMLGRKLLLIAGRNAKGMNSDARRLDPGSGTWTNLEALGTAPLRLSPAGAAMDPGGSRVFVLGGEPAEVWTLSLTPEALWRALATDTPAPVQADVPLLWDPVAGRVIAVDLSSGTNVRVWAFTPDGTPAWSAIDTSETAPRGRTSAGVAIDPVRHRLLVCGGEGEGTALGDLWELRLDGVARWNELASLPFARVGMRMACDLSRDLLVLVGGVDPNLNSIMQDVWTWPLTSEGAGWTRVLDSGVPPGFNLRIFRDDVEDRMLILDDDRNAWELRLTPAPSVTQLRTVDPGPYARVFGPAVFDAERTRLLFPVRDDAFLSTAWQLVFHSPPGPSLTCPDSGTFAAGSTRRVYFKLTEHAGIAGRFLYTLDCDRNWPGLPISGPASVDAFGSVYVPIDIPVPDTAAAGDVGFRLRLSPGAWGDPVARCEFRLSAAAPPLMALVGVAEPDRIVVRWQTLRPDVSFDISRRDGDGAWLAWQSRSVTTPGIVSLEDRAIQVGHRYSYRAEVRDTSDAGTYAIVRLDVPQWALALAVGQANPVRGPFSVQCTLPHAGRASVDVFDICGRRAFSESRTVSSPGRATFDVERRTRPASGIYFVRLGFESQRLERRIVLIR